MDDDSESNLNESSKLFDDALKILESHETKINETIYKEYLKFKDRYKVIPIKEKEDSAQP